jgi:hypothetical protein
MIQRTLAERIDRFDEPLHVPLELVGCEIPAVVKRPVFKAVTRRARQPLASHDDPIGRPHRAPSQARGCNDPEKLPSSDHRKTLNKKAIVHWIVYPVHDLH